VTGQYQMTNDERRSLKRGFSRRENRHRLQRRNIDGHWSLVINA